MAHQGDLFYPRIPAGVYHEQRGKQVLLVHPHAPHWTILNRTGWEVAGRCDGEHTPQDIAGQVAQRWGIALETALPDVESCLDGLRRAGFLDGLASDPPPAEPPALPWRLHLYLTGQCNLACRHCAVTNGSPRGAGLGHNAVVDLIDQAVAAGVEAIAFGGGEPALRPDLLDLLTYSAVRVKTLLATNATLLDEQMAAALAAAGVIVQVSLDGPDPEAHDAIRGRGAFERAWRGIRALQAAGAGERLALNVTLLRTNLGRAADIIALAAENGVPGVRFSSLARLGRAARDWDALAPTVDDYARAYPALYRLADEAGIEVSPGLLGLELEPPARGSWCGLGRTLLVDERGDIFPCGLLEAPQFCLGNVAETRLVDALHAARLQELIAIQEQRADRIPECQACPWRHFCQAGCPANVLLLQGDWYQTDGLCEVRRALFADLLFQKAE